MLHSKTLYFKLPFQGDFPQFLATDFRAARWVLLQTDKAAQSAYTSESLNAFTHGDILSEAL